MKEAMYPKILIIGQDFNLISGGGITLSNLFKGWPKEKIAVATSASMHGISTPNICGHYYINKEPPMPLMPIISRGGEDRIGKRVLRKICSVVVYFLKSLGLGPLLYGPDISDDLLRWAVEYDPDIIYTQLADINIARQVLIISDHIKKPIAVHIMDDWPLALYRKGLLAGFARRVMNDLFTKILDRASVYLAISEKMHREYALRYKKDFIVFHNPVEIETWLPFSKKDYKLHGSMRVLYSGRIGRGISASIANVAAAIELLSREGYAIEFHIRESKGMIPQSLQSKLNGYKFVKIDPPVSYEECQQRLSNADLLIIANDFDKDGKLFLSLSMPTKAPEYMITGVPILIYAPVDSALSEYASGKDLAHVVNNEDISELKKALSILYNDGNLRERLGKKAQQVAIKEHNAEIIRERFRQELCSAIPRIDKRRAL